MKTILCKECKEKGKISKINLEKKENHKITIGNHTMVCETFYSGDCEECGYKENILMDCYEQ